MIFVLWLAANGPAKATTKAKGLFVSAILVSALFFLTGCGGADGQKQVTLRNGKKVTVHFEIEETEAGAKIFVADFKNDELVRKEVTAEREVFDIWTSLSKEADRYDAEEALIKYRYSTGSKSREGKDIYELLLFAADRAETGRWEIRRVN